MAAFGLMLSLAPRDTWRGACGASACAAVAQTVWAQSELMRHSARDVAEAGRELGRFDSRPWLAPVRMPAAVVLTTRDRAVRRTSSASWRRPPRRRVFEAPVDHLELISRARNYNPALLEAMAAVGGGEPVQAPPESAP